jgi:hypothetical protein
MGESVELLPYIELSEGQAVTAEVRVIASGYISGTLTVRSFVQRFSVWKQFGVTHLSGSDAQQAYGDSGGSSWTFAASIGTSPDRLKMVFTTGTTQAYTSVVADVFITVFQPLQLSLPPGAIQLLRADKGLVPSSGSPVTTWRDLSPNGSDESTGHAAWSASNASFGNKPVLGGFGSSGTALSTGTLSFSSLDTGWTMAMVMYSIAGTSTDFFEMSGAGGFLVFGVTGSPIQPYIRGTGGITEISGINLPLSASAILITVSPTAFFGSPGASVYQNSKTAGFNPIFQGTVPTSLTSIQTQNPYGMYFADQIVWPRLLTAAEIGWFMDYASDRYAIALS